MTGIARESLRGASVALRTTLLARTEWSRAALVVFLSLASAILEGVGLSFLIPLANVLGGQSADLGFQAPGNVLGYLSRVAALEPMQIVLLTAAFFICGTIVGYLNGIVSSILAMRFAHDLRTRVFEDALSQPVVLIENLPHGKFINALTGETWRTSDALVIVINLVVQGIAVCVFSALLLLISPLYTLLLGLMTASVAVLVFFATISARRLGAIAVQANQSFMAYVWEAFAGLRLIRGFGCERRERETFSACSGAIVDVFVRLAIISGLVGPLVRIATVGIVVALVAIAFARGEEAGALAGFLAIAYRMQPRVAAILKAEARLREFEASISELERVGRQISPPKGHLIELDRIRSGIAFEGVTALYPNGSAPALVNVSCRFACGRITAVVGASGAGKSTLVALLLRFLAPAEGQIVVDGVPLSRIEPESWHRRIAFVDQSAFIFNATVRDNIAYGCDRAPESDEIWRAVRLAQAVRFIEELPHGLDTMIGDNAHRLSHGQRQRIALARALLRDPKILILDEATNSLDLPTEQSFRRALNALRPGRVVIVIAHRRETFESADDVVVLEGGKVVEAGTSQDLRRGNGAFALLCADRAFAAPRVE